MLVFMIVRSLEIALTAPTKRTSLRSSLIPEIITCRLYARRWSLWLLRWWRRWRPWVWRWRRIAARGEERFWAKVFDAEIWSSTAALVSLDEDLLRNVMDRRAGSVSHTYLSHNVPPMAAIGSASRRASNPKIATARIAGS